MIIKENYSIYNSKKIYNFSFVWSRIKQSVRAICKKFFSGLGKIQNKTLEQKTNIWLEADFFRVFYALFHCCTIDRTSLMKQNVSKKRPIFRDANAPFYS